MLDNHPGAIAILDFKGIILEINTNLAKIVGKNREELIGTSLYNYIETEKGKKHKEIIKDITKTKKPIELINLKKDRWWKESFKPIIDNEGNVIKIAYYIQDITEEKEAAQNFEKRINELQDISRKYEIITEEPSKKMSSVLLFQTGA